MSLIESSAETFEQYLELHSVGALETAELRQWVLGGTLDEAREAVEGIERPADGDGGDEEMLEALRGAGED